MMRNLASAWLMVVLCLALAGCSTPRGAALQAEVLGGADEAGEGFELVRVTRADLPRLASWPVTGWSGGYNWIANGRGPESPIIKPGDTVSLVIWDAQENSLITAGDQRAATLGEMQVSPGGTLFVPYVGEIVVRGQTPTDARAQIQKALEPFVPAAQVQLNVTAGKLNSIDLVTGVANPGSYPLVDRNTTILSMIAQGGGVSSNLRNPLVRLIRDGKTYEIRGERLFSDGSRNTTLRGGDKIFVEEDRRYFTALGASGTERIVYFDRDRVTALEALSLIGGLSDTRADPKGVLVLRSFSPEALRQDGSGPSQPDVIFVFDLTSADGLFAARSFQINPQDTVYVTESPVVAARSIMGLIGTAFGLGERILDN
jgi:polysaccharide export outer membrane protein